MFDIGWSELLVIAVVMIVVVGPKDLPKMLRAFGKATGKLRATASEFRTHFDEALRDAELDDVKKTIDDVKKYNPRKTVTDLFEPVRSAGDDLRSSLTNATPKPAETPVVTPPADSGGPMDSPLDLSEMKDEEAKPAVATPKAATTQKPAAKAEVKSAAKPKVAKATEAVAKKPAAVKKAAPVKAATTAVKPVAKPAPKPVAKSAEKTPKTTKKTGTEQ